jgi:hypothetical protein
LLLLLLLEVLCQSCSKRPLLLLLLIHSEGRVHALRGDRSDGGRDVIRSGRCVLRSRGRKSPGRSRSVRYRCRSQHRGEARGVERQEWEHAKSCRRCRETGLNGRAVGRGLHGERMKLGLGLLLLLLLALTLIERW